MTTDNTPAPSPGPTVSADDLLDWDSLPQDADDELAGIDPATLRTLTPDEIAAHYEAVRPRTIDDVHAETADNTLALLRQIIRLRARVLEHEARIDKLAATVRELAGLAGIDPGGGKRCPHGRSDDAGTSGGR